MKKLKDLQAQGLAPEWYKVEGFKTVSKGYLFKKETPKDMYERVSKSAARYLLGTNTNILGLSEDKLVHLFFTAMWNNWLCPASPVLSNSGLDRGLPISCFGLSPQDSIESIMAGACELAMLTKVGGGVGVSFDSIRPRGTPIRNGENGSTEGIIPFAKIYDSTIVGISQGSRRGAAVINLNIEHGDFLEFIEMRKPKGDVHRQCSNIHHCVLISDAFMDRVCAGDLDAQDRWLKVLKTRFETGEPYIVFIDQVTRADPQSYKDLNLKTNLTNLCCLVGDTLVATKGGPQKIKDLVGKRATVWDGWEWVTTDSFRERGRTKELIEITIASGEKITTTENHTWFVGESYEDIRHKHYRKTQAKDLKINTFLKSHFVEQHGSKKEQGAYLKGFLIGDGTQVYNKRPLLNLHFTKFMCEDALIESYNSIEGVFEKNTNGISEASFSPVREYTNPKTWGKQILKSMQGLTYKKQQLLPWVTDHKKSLPKDFREWDKITKLEFLSGILDADGSYSNSIQITQKNENLILDLRVLVNSLGYVASIDYPNNQYRLTISSYDSWFLFKELNCKRLVCVKVKPNRRLTGFRKIIKIEKITLEKDVPVYCPTIPSTGKFALSGGLMTGNSEITLHTDADHSFICCLSSLNLASWHSWKNEELYGCTLPQIATLFLNGVLNEFIEKGSQISGLEKVVRHAKKGRAIGIGVLGWHTLLQNETTPFESFTAMQLNSEIFRFIDAESLKCTEALAKQFGEPEWCVGSGRYNSHRIAIAPTRSNSTISGGVSFGIEPIISNAYTDKSSKGTFYRKNPALKKLLKEKYNKDTKDVWKKIIRAEGSVQGLSFISDEDKRWLLTAYEINQEALIRQAAQRQRWICQSQSLNLFFNQHVDPTTFNKIHLLAWKLGVKTLYYCRSEAGLKITAIGSEVPPTEGSDECKSCEG